ncbi:MAG: helix-turn-helix domain-containing protein [Gemmatimonadales bacterium]
MSRIRQTPADEPYYLIRTAAASAPRGAAVALHSHPWGQVLHATSGVLDLWTADGSWVAPSEWAIWIPPEVPHSVRLTGGTSFASLYLRPDQCGALPGHGAAIETTPLLRELFARAIAVGALDSRVPSHAAMAELIGHDLRTRPAAPLRLPLPRSEPFRSIAALVAESPGRPLSLAELSRRYGVSTRTIERGFASETGLSVGRWRRQSRLLHALRGLGSGRSVKQVARETGYATASAFVASFRAALGTTPAKYFGRDRHAGRRPSS